jgi:DNA primase
MSLPPSFLDELRSRLSLSQVVGRKVTWDMRKSNQAKGDWWAACPFHQEKSASFHVDDRKGFYYCFGCHAKGDLVSFVRETENMGFMEAIELLAREAGMPMPARDPQAQERTDRRARLSEAVEAAIRHYRLQLKTGAASQAREYLARRKLADPALDRFEIGFAPNTRQGLFQHLTAKGFRPEEIVDSGVCAKPDDGGAPYDRFRDRIIFPIRDARGRAISLGGRAMDPAARSKYLNGPETDLFDKGRSLYNHGPARDAAGKGRPLIVAEGYMDVIALSMAGFEAAVAPLGTAVTEDQLRLIWRIHPEPVIALDGDAAGIRAAGKVVDLALPLIGEGQSLRFAMMPGGKDPDDVLRDGGIPAMQAVLDRAEPMVALLWRRETEGKDFDSPERRAALDRALRKRLEKIGDPILRRHYGDEIDRRRREIFGQAGRPDWRERGRTGQGARGAAPWRPGQPRGPVAPLPSTRASVLATAVGETVEEALREAVILATLLAHPRLLAEFVAALEDLHCTRADHETIRTALLTRIEADDLPAAVAAAVGGEALENLMSAGHLRVAPALRPGCDPDVARMCLAEDFARLSARRGIRREVAEAMDDFAGLPDEGLTWRLRQAAEAAAGAGADREDRTEYDVAPNGARLSRNEKSAFDDLLRRIGFAATPPALGEEKVKK